MKPTDIKLEYMYMPFYQAPANAQLTFHNGVGMVRGHRMAGGFRDASFIGRWPEAAKRMVIAGGVELGLHPMTDVIIPVRILNGKIGYPTANGVWHEKMLATVECALGVFNLDSVSRRDIFMVAFCL